MGEYRIECSSGLWKGKSGDKAVSASQHFPEMGCNKVDLQW
jgi:hypothetical protein